MYGPGRMEASDPPAGLAADRGKQVRLAIIIAVALAMAAGIWLVSSRVRSDERAADEVAVRVSEQLGVDLEALDLGAVFIATSRAWAQGQPQTEFPGRPEILDATLVGVSSTPAQAELTYRIVSHGIYRCIVGTVDANGVATRITDCSMDAS